MREIEHFLAFDEHTARLYEAAPDMYEMLAHALDILPLVQNQNLVAKLFSETKKLLAYIDYGQVYVDPRETRL